MNVAKSPQKLPWVADIPIKPAARLPESQAAAAHNQPIEHRSPELAPAVKHALGNRLLDRLENCLRARPVDIRRQQHVYVLRHDHPPIQLDSVRTAHRSDAPRENVSNGGNSQQREPPMAGKGKKPGPASVLLSSQSLPQIRLCAHAAEGNAP